MGRNLLCKEHMHAIIMYYYASSLETSMVSRRTYRHVVEYMFVR
jgi:hypothetical protein